MRASSGAPWTAAQTSARLRLLPMSLPTVDQCTAEFKGAALSLAVYRNGLSNLSMGSNYHIHASRDLMEARVAWARRLCSPKGRLVSNLSAMAHASCAAF